MEHERPPVRLDRRPRFPERVTVDVPRGYPAKLRKAAESQGTSVSALVRDALAPLVDPLLADLAALKGAPPEQREQTLDLLVIKHGPAIQALLREQAIESATNVIRLEPKAGG